MAKFIINGGSSAQIADGTQTKLQIVSVNSGSGLLHIGDPSPEGYDVAIGMGANQAIFVPANVPASVRAEGFIVELTIGDFGAQVFAGGGSAPFWEPFTVTAAALTGVDGGFGFILGEAGSITNEPVDGFSVVRCYTYMADVVPTMFLQIKGPAPLRDNLLGALLGVNVVDFTLDDYNNINVVEADGAFDTSFEVPGVAMWTAAQSVPIVIIPTA